MVRRSQARVLFASAIALTLAACVAQTPKTDTLIVKEPAKTTSAPRVPTTTTPAAPKVDTVIPASGTLTLRNPNFATVNVEVRVGSNADCTQNPAFGTRQLQRGATWTITANTDVCWRRDANPDAPNGTFGPWNRQAVGKGTTHEATL